MKSKATEYVPPKRKDAIVRQVDGELLVLDVKTNKAHCLNQTASQVWALCDGQTSVAEMIRALSKEAATRVDEKIVWVPLAQLEKARLLPNGASLADEPGHVSRRDAVRKIGVAAALALPVVTSMVVPTVAQAASCKTIGQPCASNAECCSGLCSAVLNVCVGV